MHSLNIPKNVLFFCWKSSKLVDLMPNGNLKKRYLSHGVLNLHGMDDGSSNFTCQCPSFSSRIVTIDSPANLLLTSSGVGMVKYCLFIVLFTSLGSKYTYFVVCNHQAVYQISWILHWSYDFSSQ